MIKFLFNSFVWKTINILSSLITGILLARLLSVDDRGQYAIFISIISIYTIILNFGIPESLVYLLQKNKIRQNEFILLGLIIPSILAIVFFVLYFILYQFGVNLLYIELNSLNFLIFSCLILCSFNVLLRHLILKENLIKIFNFLSSIETVLNLLLFLILYLFNLFNLINVILVFTFSVFISFTIHIVVNRSRLVKLMKSSKDLKLTDLSKLIRIAFPLFLLGLAGVFSSKLNLFILDFFHNSENVGYYSIAIIFPNLLMIIPALIAQLAYPVSSSFNDPDKLKLYAIKILKHALFITFILTIGAYIITPLLIPILYGSVYIKVIPALFILLAGVFFGAINTILINLLISSGESKILLINSIVIVFGIFSLSFLVYYFSFMGTAITFSLLNFICFVINFLRFKNITNFSFKNIIITYEDISSIFLKFKKFIKL